MVGCHGVGSAVVAGEEASATVASGAATAVTRTSSLAASFGVVTTMVTNTGVLPEKQNVAVVLPCWSSSLVPDAARTRHHTRTQLPRCRMPAPRLTCTIACKSPTSTPTTLGMVWASVGDHDGGR